MQNESLVAMSDHPAARANAVQTQFQTTEGSIDAAISSTLELVEALMGFQREMKISPTTGDLAIAPALEAVENLRKVRSAVVTSHRQAEKISRATGLRPSMTGWSKPQITHGIIQEEVRSAS